MNKAELVYELMRVKNNIEHLRVESGYYASLKKGSLNILDGLVIDLLDEDDCSNCPAMKKMDNLADAIDQGYMISKEAKRPFKVGIITAYEAEKMARGGTD